MSNKDLFIELYSDPRFVALIKDILKNRPQIPAHDPRADNTEEWKARSAELSGFDKWITYLRVPQELQK